jgi:metal-responsive CopG/Arc/MetJ family transcriptional regulator
MYIGAVERTQIYLTAAQTRELDRRARLQGTTRSRLIRDAVEQYIGPTWDPERFRAALDGFVGIWADRTDLDEMYSDLDRRGRDRLRNLWSDRKVLPDEEELAER